ncbi:MAG: hypothetical protein ABSA46_09920 [Thermodesulfovibrionales bacterium]|jgi:hypothetical protein
MKTAEKRYLANDLVSLKYSQSKPELTMSNVAPIARIYHSRLRPQTDRRILRGSVQKKSRVRSLNY